MSKELAQCDAEIARCLSYLETGGPDEIGAYVGLTDWQKERSMILEEDARAEKWGEHEQQRGLPC